MIYEHVNRSVWSHLFTLYFFNAGLVLIDRCLSVIKYIAINPFPPKKYWCMWPLLIESFIRCRSRIKNFEVLKAIQLKLSLNVKYHCLQMTYNEETGYTKLVTVYLVLIRISGRQLPLRVQQICIYNKIVIRLYHYNKTRERLVVEIES